MNFQSFCHRVVLKSINTNVNCLETHHNFLPDSLKSISVHSYALSFTRQLKLKILSLIVHSADDDQDEMIVNVPRAVTR